MAQADLQKVDSRNKLKPRREPYWHRLEAGKYLGFRKMATGTQGSWVLRLRDDGTGKQTYHALGEFDHLPPSERFDAARKAAHEWLGRLAKGASTDAATVQAACEGYVKHITNTKGKTAAADMAARFKRHVYGDPVASIVLDKLTREHVRGWRTRLEKKPTGTRAKTVEARKVLPRPRAASSINRDMAAVRAALNHALAEGMTTTDFAWAVPLRPNKNADGKRTLYLDIVQRRRFVENADPDIANFLRGLALLPLRPGALAALTVGHFDKKLKVLTIGKDKAGHDRRIALPASTAEFLATMAGKRPAADPLLARGNGGAWDKDAWKHPIKAAAEKAGLPSETTAYTLRHSTITDLVSGGLDLLTVAQLSGTSVAMIESHYGHLLRQHATDALAGLAL